jgi:hypothetical protein
MTDPAVRKDWTNFREQASEEAIEAKDSQSALFALYAYYKSLTGEERLIIDRLLAEQLGGDDEDVWFDALAVIREFRVTSALPALRELADRLESAHGPSAPYDWAKVNRLIGYLTAEPQ